MQKFVYYPFVYALEKQGGWTPMRRYVTLITHTVHGYLPFDRFAQAGHSRMPDHLSEGALEVLTSEWLTGINPFSQVFAPLVNPKNLAWGLNKFNELQFHPVRTVFDLKSQTSGHVSWNAIRLNEAKVFNPPICDTAKFVGYEWLTKRADCMEKRKSIRKTLHISDLARSLGVTRSASCQVAEVCENLGSVSPSCIASALGVHLRTLQRGLREEGTTAELIIQAVRLIRATALLKSQKSLTEVAHETGFYDLAHMDRSFRVSAGAPPSFLRKVALGAVEPELI